jgi:hypothetical protein
MPLQSFPNRSYHLHLIRLPLHPNQHIWRATPQSFAVQDASRTFAPQIKSSPKDLQDVMAEHIWSLQRMRSPLFL